MFQSWASVTQGTSSWRRGEGHPTGPRTASHFRTCPPEPPPPKRTRFPGIPCSQKTSLWQPPRPLISSYLPGSPGWGHDLSPGPGHHPRGSSLHPLPRAAGDLPPVTALLKPYRFFWLQWVLTRCPDPTCRISSPATQPDHLAGGAFHQQAVSRSEHLFSLTVLLSERPNSPSQLVKNSYAFFKAHFK